MTSAVRTAPTVMAALAIAAITAVSVPPAQATFSLGNAGTFTVYGFGVDGTEYTDTLAPGPLTVNGNVGVGLGGDLSTAGGDANHQVVIGGQIIYGNAVTTANWDSTENGNISINGVTYNLTGKTNNSAAEQSDINTLIAGNAVKTDNALITSAKADLDALYLQVKGLSATGGAPTGNLATNFTWQGTGGNNVANLTSLNLNNDTLTLKGGANDYFIFNISGAWQMQHAAKIELMGGVNPDHVLFNLLKTSDGGGGQNVTLQDTAVGFGSILAMDRNISFDPAAGSNWTGRLFSGDTDKTIVVGSNAVIVDPLRSPQGTPEPPSVVLLLTAMLAGLGIYRFRSRGGNPAAIQQPSFAAA